jgi:hypothetical protein
MCILKIDIVIRGLIIYKELGMGKFLPIAMTPDKKPGTNPISFVFNRLATFIFLGKSVIGAWRYSSY